MGYILNGDTMVIFIKATYSEYNIIIYYNILLYRTHIISHHIPSYYVISYHTWHNIHKTYTYTCIHVYIYMYMYMYIYTYTYSYTYIHMIIETSSLVSRAPEWLMLLGQVVSDGILPMCQIRRKGNLRSSTPQNMAGSDAMLSHVHGEKTMITHDKPWLNHDKPW